MREFYFCFFVAIGFCAGTGVGAELGARSERQSIANDCKYGGSFVLRHTGYQCHAL